MLIPSVDTYDKLSNRLQAAFIRLAKDEAVWQSDLNGALRHIVTFIVETLDVGRASVWLMQDNQTRLKCLMQFRAVGGRFESGLMLSATDYPIYFLALDSGRLLDATDAVNDNRTAEFANSYLIPMGIGAVLDATLHKAGRLAGVLGIEHFGSPRLWSRDEQNFAISMADLVSQLLVFHELKDSERCYRMLFDSAGEAITMLKDGHPVDCNQQALELFRCSRDEFRVLKAAELSPPRQPDGQSSHDKAVAVLRAAARGEAQFFDWQYRRLDGTEFFAEISMNSIWLANEQYTLVIIRDVTERRNSEALREQANANLAQRNNALQVVNSLASCLHGMTDYRLIAEETVRALYKLQRSELVTFFRLQPCGKRLERLASVGSGSADLMALEPKGIPYDGSLAGLALSEQRIIISSDIAEDERIHVDGKSNKLTAGVLVLVAMPLIYRGQPLGSIGLLFHETGIAFTELELETLQAICQTVSLALANARHVQVLEHQAMHDSLTELPNRSHLHREAATAIEQASIKGEGLALMLLDLNRFKEVNDTLGHHTGDLLLKHAAERLKASLQKHNAFLARLGGDEFAVLARDIPNSAQALILAEELVAALRQPFEVQGIFVELGGSIGVATYPEHGETSNALLRCADVAMYVAKTTVGGVCAYDPAHDEHNPRRLAMITELGAAIEGDQLVLHYQPKIDLATGRWCGCEALVRWEHPVLGRIPPAEFIQFAETSDLIRPLTLWVARTALCQLAIWHAAGHNITMAINLSTRNLLDVTLPDAIAALLTEYGVAPGMLKLEITETALISDPDRALMVVGRLVTLGMQLSIDDFGTGYSSLAYLKRLPLHELKIDRSFVKDMMRDEQDAIIVRSTIALAHSLGLRVVAEGVEEADTLQALYEFGCDEAQGYFLSKPLPAEQIGDVLNTAGIKL